jgi:hypothetical protein
MRDLQDAMDEQLLNSDSKLGEKEGGGGGSSHKLTKEFKKQNFKISIEEC